MHFFSSDTILEKISIDFRALKKNPPDSCHFRDFREMPPTRFLGLLLIPCDNVARPRAVVSNYLYPQDDNNPSTLAPR